MKFFTDEGPELSEDISSDLSLDLVTLITNFNKKLESDNIEWQYGDRTHQMSIKTKKMYIHNKFPFHLELIDLRKTDVNFTAPLIANHVFKSTWYYKVFLTEILVNIMKYKNNLSVYFREE